MSEYDASTYGDRVAEVYDQGRRVVSRNTEATVEFLAARAGRGPILELGIGTGRVALPLQERGIEVHGIDASRAMVAKLRAKPGGERLPVVIGDFAEVPIEGHFSLVFVVFNTFFGLLSQEDQIRCFSGVARHLTVDGAFVIEAFVPDPSRFDRRQRVAALDVDADAVELEVSVHDPVQQKILSQHVVCSDEGVRLYPVQVRYAWPSELDLMARLAGLRLQARHGGWGGEPFTATSMNHVSVYERIR
jgi:SAM-dependent methyltransferase